MKIILLGKPLSGKGTQAALLSKKLSIPHLSTGDLLREQLEKKTALGKKAKSYMDDGGLVPDSLVFSLLKKKLSLQKGFLLDGFPRDIVQAEALEKIVSVDLAIDVECSDRLIIKRTVSRRMCEKCGAIYGLDVRPRKKGICSCGGKLFQRKDDNEKTIRKRLTVYNKESFPLISFYKKKKKYFSVSGDAPIADVQRKILRRIEKIK